MQDMKFDEDAARKSLMRKEMTKVAEQEHLRQQLLNKTIDILRQELKDKNLEVWLIGSITCPHRFTKRSDVDIVVKNYFGDRFDLWTLLEKKIEHEIEIIRYEECHFRDEIPITGLKVL